MAISTGAPFWDSRPTHHGNLAVEDARARFQAHVVDDVLMPRQFTVRARSRWDGHEDL